MLSKLAIALYTANLPLALSRNPFFKVMLDPLDSPGIGELEEAVQRRYAATKNIVQRSIASVEDSQDTVCIIVDRVDEKVGTHEDRLFASVVVSSGEKATNRVHLLGTLPSVGSLEEELDRVGIFHRTAVGSD